jgi:guanylate kinase
MSNEPLLLIVSSPSGAGKTTLTGRLLAAIENLHFSVSHTTRGPRAGEQNGREYHFVSRERFEELARQGEFLEWAEVHGNLYGTSRQEVARAHGARGVVFDIDHQGARQIKSAVPDAVAVFILPPSMQALLDRLDGRKSDDAETVRRRYDGARAEITHYGEFDYIVVNDVLDDAVQRLVGIFRAEECRRWRVAPLAERLLVEG